MKIISIEPLGIQNSQYEALRKEFHDRGHEFYMHSDRDESPEAIVHRAQEADVMIASNIPLGREIIEKLPSLKLLNIAFTGVDHVDIEACRDHNITVCNAAGYSTTAVTELTIGLMLDVLKKITAFDACTRAQKTREGFLGREISNKTIGIIGTGAIGQNVISILKAMGTNVLAYSRTEKQEVKNLGVQYVSLDKIMESSDIVSVHIPSNRETHHLLNDEKLSRMKNSAVLINAARGPIVDYVALAQLLKNGQIAGAGIDVYEHEPPIEADHDLMDAPNTVLLPHIAYATEEAMKIRAEIVKENIFQWLKRTPQNVIDQPE